MALTLAVKSIQSLDDSTEVGPDEPYVLVTGVNLDALVPQVEVTLYGPWGDVEKGETHGTLVIPPTTPPALVEVLSALNVVRRPFWGLDNKTAVAITDPSKVIFIVSVMENDDGRPAALRTLVKGTAVASLAASNGMARATRVQKLLADLKGTLGIPTGAPNFDDTVGSKELVLTAADLVPPSNGKRVKTLDFAGGNEGKFRVAVELAFA